MNRRDAIKAAIGAMAGAALPAVAKSVSYDFTWTDHRSPVASTLMFIGPCGTFGQQRIVSIKDVRQDDLPGWYSLDLQCENGECTVNVNTEQLAYFKRVLSA